MNNQDNSASNETKNSLSKRFQTGREKVWASIKKKPALWAITALAIISVCYHSYALYQIERTVSILTQDVRRSIFLKTYDYKVVSPDDERFTTFMNNQGALGWEIVHARRATRRDGYETIPIYEVILMRERVFR